MAQITLPVEGMNCNHCKTAVEKSMIKVPGVSRAEVDLGGKKVTVDYNAAQASMEDLVKAVEDAGYSTV